MTARDDDIIARLSSPKLPLNDDLPDLPPVPGLYAIHGDAAVWAELRLDPVAEGIPLYVGKAEDSLVSRDLRTHFNDGRTGSSTVRRSFAALLADRLEMTGVPRNLKNPGAFSNYGLSPADDRKLTTWMRSRLTISIWPSDQLRPLRLDEAHVLKFWNPPINLQGLSIHGRTRSHVAARGWPTKQRLGSQLEMGEPVGNRRFDRATGRSRSRSFDLVLRPRRRGWALGG